MKLLVIMGLKLQASLYGNLKKWNALWYCNFHELAVSWTMHNYTKLFAEAY